MKRIAVILLALIVPATIIAVTLLWMYEPGLPKPGRQVLDSYTAQSREAPFSAEQIVRATNPDLLTADLNTESFGNESYFMVSHHLNAQVAGDNVRPLPFPPQEVWCASIDMQTGVQATVFVALHGDLYKAVWVVHKLPPTLPQQEKTDLLTRIGCSHN